jgi:hypothetical protein
MLLGRAKRREKEERRKEEERREVKCQTMPAAKAPTGVVNLRHGAVEGVWCIVPLPGGGRVANASNKGKVRVFAVSTGALEHELDAHAGDIWGARSGRAWRRRHRVGRV